MALNELYVLDPTLENYFVDKDTGEPLAAGTIEFYKDNDRTTAKAVYELTGAPPNYTYTALPNPLTLSAVGTVQDAGGDNVAMYFYPYDEDGNVELYYLVVKDSSGNEQFTREAWPNIIAGANDNSDRGSPDNEVSNPQFVDSLFTSPLTITFSGTGTDTIYFAPGWRLELSYTGAGTAILTRTPVAGSSNYPTNPPYVITVTGGANISAIEIIQSLPNNPGIWSPAISEERGFVGSAILLADGSSADILYRQYNNGVQTGASQTLLSQTNNTGAYALMQEVVQLDPSTNAATGETGSVDLVVSLPPAATTSFSSVQIVGLDAELQDFPFAQQTAARQRDFLSHYYKPQLAFKPVPSYLVGWDFPLNPAQLGETQAASSIGANKAKYVWDQTILFQSVDNSVGVTRDSDNGSIKLTATADTQPALIQYLDNPIAKKILSDPSAFFMRAKTDNTGNAISGTVSLWATTDVSLPDVSTGSNNSLIATIDASGKPATFNGTWVEVARGGLGEATFDLTDSFTDINLSGWDGGAGLSTTATYFAIVIGFETLDNTKTIDVLAASLAAGDIATLPAPKTVEEVRRECQRYYEVSYDYNAGSPGAGAPVAAAQAYQTGTTYVAIPTEFSFLFKAIKRATPTLTVVSPTDVTTAGQIRANIRYVASAAVTSQSAAVPVANSFDAPVISVSGVTYSERTTGSTLYSVSGDAGANPMSAWFNYQYFADARLGIV